MVMVITTCEFNDRFTRQPKPKFLYKLNFFFLPFILFITLFTLVFLNGCGAKKEASPPAETLNLKYATGFKIERLPGGYQKVTDGENRTLILVPQGKTPQAEYKDLPVIYTPVKRVVVFSTTDAALLKVLGELDSIVGVTSKKEEWYIDKVKEGLERGTITYLGSSMTPDYEKIKALKPEVVFIYTGAMGGSEIVKKLDELGIPYAVNNSWLEKEPLGRLEWIKFMAAFYNKGQEAESYFEDAVKKVESLKGKVGSGQRPRVVWGSIFKGKVYVPAGGSYVARMIDLAGGDYAFKDLEANKGGSVTISLEEFYARSKEADIFIYASSPNYGVSSLEKLVQQGPVLADIKSVKENKVWAFQPWYYQSLDKTAEQIEDLAAILHPASFAGYQIKHFLLLPPK